MRQLSKGQIMLYSGLGLRKKKKKKRKTTSKNPILKRSKATATKRKKRAPNPTSLAKKLISGVAEPGSTFSLTALKAGFRKAGYRNVGGWFDEMLKDAKRKRLISAVSKSIYAYTPAATNPCGARRKAHKKKK